MDLQTVLGRADLHTFIQGQLYIEEIGKYAVVRAYLCMRRPLEVQDNDIRRVGGVAGKEALSNL
jgi:hypothetical protein